MLGAVIKKIPFSRSAASARTVTKRNHYRFVVPVVSSVSQTVSCWNLSVNIHTSTRRHESSWSGPRLGLTILNYVSNFKSYQEVHNINKYKMYLQPLLMFRQINCHPQGVSIKELQVRTASKYTIDGFIVEVLTSRSIHLPKHM
jgi:hypothetical protein